MKKVVVLTGAGVSAESGIKTFRDHNGLWENHDVMDVASPEGWKRNPQLVLEFYNQRRKQLKTVHPNLAHQSLVKLEEEFQVDIVTQNVDDLHERAGSTNVLHLHGSLIKVRSVLNSQKVYDWKEDLHLGDTCDEGGQLRPHIVWFGEAVPLIQPAAAIVYEADIILIIGTSMQVYPAAGLVGLVQDDIPIYYIDPKPSINHELQGRPNLNIYEMTATQGTPKLVELLLKET